MGHLQEMGESSFRPIAPGTESFPRTAGHFPPLQLSLHLRAGGIPSRNVVVKANGHSLTVDTRGAVISEAFSPTAHNTAGSKIWPLLMMSTPRL